MFRKSIKFSERTGNWSQTPATELFFTAIISHAYMNQLLVEAPLRMHSYAKYQLFQFNRVHHCAKCATSPHDGYRSHVGKLWFFFCLGCNRYRTRAIVRWMRSWSRQPVPVHESLMQIQSKCKHEPAAGASPWKVFHHVNVSTLPSRAPRRQTPNSSKDVLRKLIYELPVWESESLLFYRRVARCEGIPLSWYRDRKFQTE